MSAAWTSDRVPGHTLSFYGFDMGLMTGNRSWSKRARCSCGEVSKRLRTDTARKQWHREHKAEVFLRRTHKQEASNRGVGLASTYVRQPTEEHSHA